MLHFSIILPNNKIPSRRFLQDRPFANMIKFHIKILLQSQTHHHILYHLHQLRLSKHPLLLLQSEVLELQIVCVVLVEDLLTSQRWTHRCLVTLLGVYLLYDVVATRMVLLAHQPTDVLVDLTDLYILPHLHHTLLHPTAKHSPHSHHTSQHTMYLSPNNLIPYNFVFQARIPHRN